MAFLPQTMEYRMLIAKKFINEQNILTPVLLDEPKNDFWKQARQAPNMSLLISTEGGWFSINLCLKEKNLNKLLRKK